MIKKSVRNPSLERLPLLVARHSLGERLPEGTFLRWGRVCLRLTGGVWEPKVILRGRTVVSLRLPRSWPTVCCHDPIKGHYRLQWLAGRAGPAGDLE